jgi:hypothetical protein
MSASGRETRRTLALLLVLEALIMVTPVVLSFTPPALSSQHYHHHHHHHHHHHPRTTQLFQLTPGGRADMDVVFGSEQHDSSSKTDGGVYDEDMDDDQRDRLKRRETVQALLQEQEKTFRADRKQKQWGKFANVTNKQELEPLILQELQKVEQGTYTYVGRRLATD